MISARHVMRIALIATLLAAPLAGQTLPSLAGEGASNLLSQQSSFKLADLRFTGNTVFDRQRLLDASLDLSIPGVASDPGAKRVRDLIGQTVTLEQLEQARVAITLVYVNAGHINSGAVLDEQPVDDGVVVMRVIEGQLSDIKLSGNERLRELYLRPRIEAGAGRPLNINSLRDQLEIMRQNPNVSQVNAELRPGAELGQSTLDVRVAEQDTFKFGVIFDNHRSPSIGAERVSLFASHDNLLGFSDRLYLQTALTEGGLDEMHIIGYENGNPPFSEWPEIFVDYAIPITPRDTTLAFSFQKTDSRVLDSAFDDLNIDSELYNYALTLRHPVYRTPSSELALFASLNYKQNETTLLGEPFSFSTGAIRGQSEATMLRLGQEYFHRDTQQAVALRSTFTFGLDMFDPTVNPGTTPDGQFWAWLGQGQYVRRLGNSDVQAVARVSMQLTDQSLLAIEQIAIGGVDTVRGYRENASVRDSGVAASLELRVPIYQKPDKQIGVTLIPFFDIGYAWNHNGSLSEELLSSVGIGLSADYTERFSTQIFYGYALNEVDESDDNLQDFGLHFQFVVRLF